MPGHQQCLLGQTQPRGSLSEKEEMYGKYHVFSGPNRTHPLGKLKNVSKGNKNLPGLWMLQYQVG